jgi:uncharacterized protein involved in exopolysaccharide biosynthesis
MNARDDEIDLMYYWNVLWRHKRLIIGLCAVSVARSCPSIIGLKPS